MAKLTIAQLTAQLEAAHVAYAALGQRAAALAADNAALRLLVPAAKPNRRVVPQRPVDPAHLAYLERARAAREEAMRTGKSVLVG